MVRMASGTKCAGPFDWPRARNCGAELGIAGLALRQSIAGSASGTTARGFRPLCCRPHRQPRSRGRFHILLYFMYFCHSIAALSVTVVLQATRLKGSRQSTFSGTHSIKGTGAPVGVLDSAREGRTQGLPDSAYATSRSVASPITLSTGPASLSSPASVFPATR